MTLPEGAELGSTEDPKALIKGEPGSVTAAARALSDEKRKATTGKTGASAVSMGRWEGGYGQAAWTSSQQEITSEWGIYATLLDTVSGALDGYADALTTAQGKAQDAIDKWNEGEDATDQAVKTYNQAVTSYNNRVRQLQVPTYGPPSGSTSAGSPPGPFVDPGAGMRAEAERILKDARENLDDAGVTAIKEIAGMIGPQTDGGTGPDADANADIDIKFSWENWDKTFGDTSAMPDDPNGKKDSPFKLDIGSIDAEASAWGARGSFEDYLGGVHVKGDGSVDLLQAKGDASLSLSGDGLEVHAGAKALVVGADGKLDADLGPAEAGVDGSLEVGAGGEGGITINGSGLKADAEVFAGVKAAVGGHVDIGGVGAEAEVEGQAGFGASAELDAGVEGGALHIDVGGGAAFILGARVHTGITIDPGKVVDTLGDLIP